MTLPEALLKRLAKRGIIADGNNKSTSGAAPESQTTSNGDSDRDRDERESDESSEHDSDDDEGHNDGADDGRRETELVKEEIIAEDYDEFDPDAFEYASKKKTNPAQNWSEKMKQKMTKRYGYQSVDGCQNKYNIHHLCTMYCVKRYGEVEFEIEKEYEKRVKRLLERYPLPKSWRKEYDIGCRAFYFYNKDTRVVSWLPPTHPDAKLTKSAKQLRRELMEEQKQKEAAASEGTPQTIVVESYPPTAGGVVPPAKPLIGPTNTAAAQTPGTDGKGGSGIENLKPPVVNPPKRPPKPATGGRDDDKRSSRPYASGNDGGETASDADRERDYRERNRDRRERERERDRDRRDRDRSPVRSDDRFGTRERDRNRDRDHHHHRDRRPPRGPPKSAPLDPMDPAAYSDIPRGTWSAGLETAAGGSKKEKDERKKPTAGGGRGSDNEDDGGEATGDNGNDEGAHEVLKISAVQEFHQEEEDEDEDME